MDSQGGPGIFGWIVFDVDENCSQQGPVDVQRVGCVWKWKALDVEPIDMSKNLEVPLLPQMLCF